MYNETIQDILWKAILILGSFYLTLYFEKFVLKIFNVWLKSKSTSEEVDQTVVSFVKIIFKIVLWIVVALFVLQNLGLQITALLGGIGVAGLAVAFAFQKILEDVFSFFLIYFDKPFKVGDFIMVGQDSGTVKNIGVRMTKLTMPAGQELLISNRELTNSRLQNFKKMKKRGTIFNFSVSYDTPVEKLERIDQIITSIFNDLNKKDVELSRVHFKALGESALIFEVSYQILSKEFDVYMNLQEKINLAMIRSFAKEKISFAYPTQTIKVQKTS